MAVVAHYSKVRSAFIIGYCGCNLIVSRIDNKYIIIIDNNVRQPWLFSVTWRHGTRDIRFATSHFLLVVLWNWDSIYIGFWRYWALSMLQYPSRKWIWFFHRGPRPKKVTEGPGWLRYATAPSRRSVKRGCIKIHRHFRVKVGKWVF